MKKRMSFRGRATAAVVVFFAAVFALPASRSGDGTLWMLAAVIPGVMLILLLLPSRVLFLDRPSLAAALALAGFWIMAGVYSSPAAVLSRAVCCAGALFFLLLGAVLVRSFRASFPAAALSAVIALGMLSCPLWYSGSFSLNGAGIALLLFSAAAFLPLRMYLPALGSVLCGLLLLLLQQSLPASLLLGLSCVLLFWASSGSGLWSGISLAAVGGLLTVYIGFLFPLTGDSAASLLPRIAAVSLLAPETPAGSVSDADPLFILLGEQYGLVFLLLALFLLCLLLIRGSSLALGARTSFHASLALGAVLFFGLRALLFMLALAGILPFAAGELPFMTDSVPDLCADFLLLGLLSGISARNETDLEEDTRLSMLAR